MKRFSFPILFLSLLLLIFSVAFARELAENKNEKHVTNEVDGRFPFIRPPIHLPPMKPIGGVFRPRPKLPRGCSLCRDHCCNGRCCSSEEYAEFDKARRVP
ncbi:unnamed protein product [Victoria cruziana]